jgi:hypothetical protein
MSRESYCIQNHEGHHGGFCGGAVKVHSCDRFRFELLFRLLDDSKVGQIQSLRIKGMLIRKKSGKQPKNPVHGPKIPHLLPV